MGKEKREKMIGKITAINRATQRKHTQRKRERGSGERNNEKKKLVKNGRQKIRGGREKN